jgi:uridine kinase
MTATVVSISGPSGSGKSSLVKAIVKLLPDACSLHFDDYKETTKSPDDLKKWLSDGCNPDDFVNLKMVDDLTSLRKQRNGVGLLSKSHLAGDEQQCRGLYLLYKLVILLILTRAK